MRTTLSIDDDVLLELRTLARERHQPLTRTANAVMRAGLSALAEGQPRRQRYRERPVDLGTPSIDLTKALALSADLEDEEIARKLASPRSE